MKKQSKKLLALVLAAAMILTFFGTGVVNQKKSAKAATDYGLENPRTERGITTWDKVKFGSYKQTAILEPEPIKWRVLSVEGDDVFLLADQCLDAEPYDEKGEDVTWETCTLRQWLNDDFYNEAFSEEEQKAIKQTTVVNEDNAKHGTEGGNDTTDNIFLLSISEVSNSDYGFAAAFDEQTQTRKAELTDYAKLNGGGSKRWLRSPGSSSCNAAIVLSNIYGDTYGYDSGYYVTSNFAVRPALHINLSSARYTDAGKVTSSGTVSEEKNTKLHNPTTDENGVTTWDCIYFGNYKQTAKWEKEPIEWRVLSVNGDDAFLLADRCLVSKPYNEKCEAVTWETCTLRQWLNQDFYNEAFNENEKEAIKPTKVINEDNEENGTEGGNDTTDNIFLLSISEVSTLEYGFQETYVKSSKARIAKITDYADINGGICAANGKYAGNGFWWLRTPGDYSHRAAGLWNTGTGSYAGTDVGGTASNGHVVRPALHINLSSAQWSKSGEASTEDEEISSTPTPSPTAAPTQTPDQKPTPTPSTPVMPTPPASATPSPTTPSVSDYGLKNPRTENGVTTWDKVKFGSYNQTAIFEPEPIKWRVLSIDGDDAFLLADQCLDCKPYNDQSKDVTWETCTLRKWLNKDFYNEAFSENEKKAIMQTTVVNEDNPGYNTEGGNDTKDNVFLLSITEASNPKYGFKEAFGAISKTREAKVTDYAKFNNGRHSMSEESFGNGYWWLRSPGNDSKSATFCGCDGSGWGYGFSVYHDNIYVVRPALHINLSTALYTDAGKVTSSGIVSEEKDTDINNPTTDENGVTTWDCIYFGNYKQTVKYEKEPIEWRVLSVNGDDAFLLADRCLDAKLYNEENKDVTWETCSLRKWLNNEFYNEAFSKEEQKLITQTTVVNDDNSEHGTEERNATNDNVFLLSIAEASNPIYGFAENFAESSKTRKAKVTDYAWLNDRWHNIDENYAYGAWWLRSPSLNSCMAANVSNSGCGDEDYVVNSGHVIRPALHINLSSAQISESGEISVKSGDIDEPTPSEKPTPTPPPSGLVTPDPTTPVVPGPSVSTTPTTTVPQTQNPTGTNLTGITAQEQQATKNDTKRKKQKKLKLSSIKAKRNKKKITGKVSVSKATVKIKVGKKAYKKAKVKGKKFTLNVKKLKKKTKITIRVTKKGYRTLKKTVRVK